MHARYASSGRLVLAASLLFIAACAPPGSPSLPEPARAGLPPIPRVDGALAIRVVHPAPDQPRPRVDSTFIYGSVGTGAASLAINGTPIEVAPNGAFLAFLPIPADGAWRLSARAGGRTDSASVAYRPPPTAPAADRGAAPRAGVEEITPARIGRITGGADTLASGSDVAIGRPTPGGTYRWFLPRGARVAVTGRLGDQLRVQLGDSVAWFAAEQIALEAGPPPAPPADAPMPSVPPVPPAPPVGLAIPLPPQPGWIDLAFDADSLPFLVETGESYLDLTLYTPREAPPGGPPAGIDPLLRGIEWSRVGPGALRARIRLSRPLWGYKAFYTEGGDLTLRLRRPPEIDPMSPLRGRRIVIDPGHPPAGATGPTGLTEAEANLAIALRLAEQLRARGAEVLLTRTDATPSTTTERVQKAVAWNAELLVSVHNNALAEGVNPFRSHGTSVYYFHPFSAPLARALDRDIVEAARIPDLGARWSNLALARPTWMPSALTESLFMLIPEQEAALRDPGFLDRLAAAHVRGIESFLRGTVTR